MEIFGEDYNGLARLLARLEVRFPSVNWRARFVALAPSFAPIPIVRAVDQWFTNEIGRLADAYKG